MTTLSPATLATNSAATEGDVKNFLTNLRTFIGEMLGTDSADKGAALAAMAALLYGSETRNATFSLTADQRSKAIICTGTTSFTINLAPAATLGDGFTFAISNNSSAAITLDPNLTETIDGATTYSMAPKETLIVYCDGAKWLLFGKSPAVLTRTFNTRSGDVTLTSSDVSAALGYTPGNQAIVVPKDFGAGNYPVGCTATLTSYSAIIAIGATVVGSANLVLQSSSQPVSGTWRNISNYQVDGTGGGVAISGLFQRIA